LYNCTLAMFQAGGDDWDRWNGVVRDRLIGLQKTAGCNRGSWDATGYRANEAGRVCSTAWAILSLEVYYRFSKQENKPAEK
jgi:hypothetical protein